MGAGACVACGHRGADRRDAAGYPDLFEGGEVPAFGRVDRDGHRAGAGAADPAADDQQPGGEEPGGAAVLDRLEERQVHEACRVVQGGEDDPLAGADRRRLRCHLGACDQDHFSVLPVG